MPGRVPVNRICPVCELPLQNDDEQIARHVLSKAVWMHYGPCGDAWDAQPGPPPRNPSKKKAA